MNKIASVLLFAIFITATLIVSHEVKADVNSAFTVEVHQKAYIDSNVRKSVTLGILHRAEGAEVIRYGILRSPTASGLRLNVYGVEDHPFLPEDIGDNPDIFGVALTDMHSALEDVYYTRAYAVISENGAERNVYSDDIICVDINENSIYAGGTGIDSNPYIIAAPEHFISISENLGAAYKIISDITLPEDYTPISGFRGKLSGDDYENLRVVTVNISTDGNGGLFADAAEFEIENIWLKGAVEGAQYVGGFVGRAEGGNIENCVNEATVTGEAFVGGIAGGLWGRLSYTSNHGDITASYNVGGIIGTILDNNTAIEKSYNTGTVTALSTDGRSGGIAGSSDKDYLIINCYNTGEIDARGLNSGGIAAIGANAVITNCYNTGLLKNQDISPVSPNGNVKNCYYLENNWTYADAIGVRCTPSELKNIVFSGGVLAIDEGTAYPLHEIKGLPHYTAPVGIEELQDKINGALPGAEIVLKDGVYENVNITVGVSGGEDFPITIRAQTPGRVVFSGGAEVVDTFGPDFGSGVYEEKVKIVISGDYIVVRDFRFERVRQDSSVILLDGASGCRITECYFYFIFGGKSTFVSCITASNISQNNRVDHCVFETTGGGLHVAVGYNENTMNTDNKADHNYYKDVPAVSAMFPGQTNGFEQATAGTTITYDHNRPRMVLEHNLFENIVGDVSELICIKSSENIVRYNTFLNNNQSGPDFRNGQDCTFEGNFSINSKIGMRSYGRGQSFINNYFYKCPRGLELTTTNEGHIFSEGSQYRQTIDAVVEGNTFIYSSYMGIKLGSGFNPLEGYIYVPENTTISDNVFVMDRGTAITHSNSVSDNFSNNKVSLSGSARLGTTAEGFKAEDIELEFDGQIYVPKGMDIDKTGLKTVYDVGPVNRWWMKLLKNPPADLAASVKEPDTPPIAYVPSQTKISLVAGEEYNLDNLTGRAQYADGREYSVLSQNVSYSASNGNGSISGHILTANNTGTVAITAEYRGCKANVSITISQSSVDESAADGKIYKKASVTASGTTIDNTALLTGDFELSCTMRATGNAAILLGYKGFVNPDYYSVRLGGASGIFKYNDSISDCIGLINTPSGEEHNIVIRKQGDKLTVIVDGEFAGIANVDENLTGRLGFVAATFSDISITRIATTSNSNPQNITINAERTDVEEVELTFEDTLSEVIYRIYRDDLWLYDTRDKYTDVSVKKGREYTYRVEAYNNEGALQGRGELLYILSTEVPGDLFQITECEVKTGFNGAFAKNMYGVRNKGFSEEHRVYCDRNYTYSIIPEELRGAGFIATRNDDISFLDLQNAATADFMKFDINKSATVYILVCPNQSQVVPEWIKSWELTDLTATIKTTGTLTFSRIYKKDFEGMSTVTIGGFSGKLSAMYTVVVKPK